MLQPQPPVPLPAHVDPSWRIGIVRSSYYKEEVDALTQGARTTLLSAGIALAKITVHDAAGSFEIPLIGAALAKSGAVDALIGIGIVVQGETEHARLLAENVARGIMDTQLQYLIPFAFEVLYVKDLAQARARSASDHNKGSEAALSVLQSLAELSPLRF